MVEIQVEHPSWEIETSSPKKKVQNNIGKIKYDKGFKKLVDAHICFSSHTSDLESLVRNYRSTISTIKPDKSTVQLSKQVQNKSKCSKITGQSQIAVMRLLILI